MKWIALRYFNAAGAWPDGSIGEDHADEIHLIPLAIRAANGGTAAEGVRRRLSDAGRDLPARLHPRLRSRLRPHPRARSARARRAVRGVSTSEPARRIRSARSLTPSAGSSAGRSPGNLRRAGPEILRYSMQPVTARSASWGGGRNIPSWRSSSGMRGSGTRLASTRDISRVSYTDR